jgi:general secretion pathway protein D
MHIKVEVSQVTSTETIGGVQQPIISQRVNEADLRMKDGEASLLGGLTNESDTQSVAGIPGVANIPLLGYLFGTHTRDKEKDDIVIALVPHIIRAPDVDTNDQGVLAGTDRVVRVERKPAESGGENSSQPNAPVNGRPAMVPTPAPKPATPQQLPPLGKVLNAPLGSVGRPSYTASGAYTPTQQSTPASNSIQLYLAPRPDATADPQAAPDPNTPEPPTQTAQPNSLLRKPALDPNVPLELTTEVVPDSKARPGTSTNGSSQQH